MVVLLPVALWREDVASIHPTLTLGLSFAWLTLAGSVGAFSLWFFNVLFFIIRGILNVLKIGMTENLGTYGAPSPMFAHIGMGAFLVLVFLDVAVDQVGDVAVVLVLFLFEEGVVVILDIDIVIRRGLGVIGGIGFFKRNHVRSGGGIDLNFVVFRLDLGDLGLRIEIGARIALPGIGRDDRVTPEIVEFLPRNGARALGAEFSLGQCRVPVR